jgi:hypothetical protein
MAMTIAVPRKTSAAVGDAVVQSTPAIVEWRADARLRALIDAAPCDPLHVTDLIEPMERRKKLGPPR